VIFRPNSPFIHVLTLGRLPYKNLAPSCSQTLRRSRPPQTGRSRRAATESSDQRRAVTAPLCCRPTRYSAGRARARASLPSIFAALWACSFDALWACSFDAQIYWVCRLCVMRWADSSTGFQIKCCFPPPLPLFSVYVWTWLQFATDLSSHKLYNRYVVLD